MNKWKTLDRQEAFKTKRITLFREFITDGVDERYSTFISQTSSGVCIIPYIPDIDSFILVKQFRSPLKEEIWQFPAGGVNKGESLLAAAKRELSEETGYVANKVLKLGEFYPDAELIETKGNFFLALNPIKKNTRNVQVSEKVEVKVFSEEQLIKDVFSGKIRDGWTLSAFCLFLIWKRKKG